MKKLVIIPTYNERENVSRMISKVMSLFGGYDLLIVDDGSSQDSGGHWHTVTIWFTRWTATFRTTPTIWNG